MFFFFFFLADNLQVTGISRSGRVRKKSSKLADFRTNYDTDATNQIKRSSHTTKNSPTKLTNLFLPEIKNDPIDVEATRIDLNDSNEFSDDLNILDGEPYHLDDDDIDDDDLLIAMDAYQSIDLDSDRELNVDTTVRQSAYMAEKTNRKKVFKDGRIVLGRLQRKDKGKPRFTSYMLWAREKRQDMINSNPNLDFSTQSRRLSEMWANMPSCDKLNWRRKAKRLAVSKKSNVNKLTASISVFNSCGSSSGIIGNANIGTGGTGGSGGAGSGVGTTITKFLNKSGNPNPVRRPGRPPKIKKPGRKPKIVANLNDNKIQLKSNPKMKTKKIKKFERKIVNSTPKKLPKKIATNINETSILSINTCSTNSKLNQQTLCKTTSNSTVTPGPYRVTGLGPTEVAAHLKLLGDNLTIIGERLKEHEVKHYY